MLIIGVTLCLLDYVKCNYDEIEYIIQRDGNWEIKIAHTATEFITTTYSMRLEN